MAIGYQCTKTLFDIMSIVINKKKYSGVIRDSRKIGLKLITN